MVSNYFETFIAAKLNNYGALLLESRHYDLAMPIFQEAAQALKNSLSGEHPTSSQQQKQHNSPDGISQDPRIERAAECLRESVEMHQFSNEESKTTVEGKINILLGTVARNQVVVIPSSPSRIQLSTTGQDAKATYRHYSMEEISSSIIYNMALTHHLQGIKTGSAQNIEKALQLYGLALSSLSTVLNDTFNAVFTVNNSDDSHKVKLQVLHSLALFNNMGHACCQLGRHSATTVYFEKMLRIARWYSDLELFSANLQGCGIGAAAA